MARRLYEAIFEYRRKNDDNRNSLLDAERSLWKLMCWKDATYEASC